MLFMDNQMNYMDKTMIDQKISFYDNTTPWEAAGQKFLIRGLALNEVMLPALIRHGEKTAYPWPWLLVYFDDPVVLNTGTSDEMNCEKSVMLWPPRSSHRYGNSAIPWRHSWIILDDPGMNEFLMEFPIPTGVPVAADASQIFAKYLILLYNEITQNKPDPFIQKQLVRLFFYELHRLCVRPQDVIPPHLQQIKLYILNHFTKDISLDTLAAHFNISVPHLAAIYRKYFHITPMNYINTLRMEQAAKLLRLYPYSCKEVATLSGFHDPLYFSRRFHQYWGLSPREYRRQNRIYSASDQSVGVRFPVLKNLNDPSGR